MKKILATILAIALFAGLATIGLAIALTLLGACVLAWIYARITGKHPLQHMMHRRGQSTESPEVSQTTIDAEYEVIDEAPEERP